MSDTREEVLRGVYYDLSGESRRMTECDTERLEAIVDELLRLRRELAAARECSGCGSPRLTAILAVVRGQAACCPDCSTLTMEERNSIQREAVWCAAYPRQEGGR